MKTKSALILLSGMMATTALAPAVSAQDAAAEGDRVQSVYDRARPDYDAPGIRTGSFLFYPRIAAEAKYDSNIYAKVTGETDDFIAIVKPSFNLVSDWNDSYLSLMADAAIHRYADNGGEDREDYKIGVNARKDISSGTNMTFGASYDQKHEDRGSAENSVQDKPTPYTDLKANIGFERDVSVISLKVEGSYLKKNFDDVMRTVADSDKTFVVDKDKRDRHRTKGTVQLGYELADGYDAFVRGTIDRVKYRLHADPTNPKDINRNSDGYEAVAGAAFDLTGKVKGEVYGGYMKRAYDSNKSIDGMNFGASLLWNATGLTSFTGAVKRSIDETTVADEDGKVALGIVSTLVSGRVEHELRRNVLLSADANYIEQKFDGTSRTDDLINASAGVKYLLNRNVNVNLTYEYKYRDSSDRGSDYSRHGVMVNVAAQW